MKFILILSKYKNFNNCINFIGQACGLTLCLMNISLVINPFIFGYINDNT